MKMKKLSKSREDRAAFVSSQIDVGIPFQIRALREQRNMDQKALANAARMAQPRISAIESPGYGSFTLDTLKRVAAAFDVALIVRFGAFSELVKQSNEFSPDSFRVPSFETDLAAGDQSLQNTASAFLHEVADTAVRPPTPRPNANQQIIYVPGKSGTLQKTRTTTTNSGETKWQSTTSAKKLILLHSPPSPL